MKSIFYNPTDALSILLAAVILEKYPAAKLKKSEESADSLFELLDEVDQKRELVSLLKEENTSDRSDKIKLAILADYHDVKVFENQYELLKVFKGDLARLGKMELRGDAIKKFYESPAFLKATKVFSNDANKKGI